MVHTGISLEELGLRALERIPRDRAIDGIHAFNEMRYDYDFSRIDQYSLTLVPSMSPETGLWRICDRSRRKGVSSLKRTYVDSFQRVRVRRIDTKTTYVLFPDGNEYRRLGTTIVSWPVQFLFNI